MARACAASACAGHAVHEKAGHACLAPPPPPPPPAAVFFNIGTTQSSAAKRLPSLFFCCINQVRKRWRHRAASGWAFRLVADSTAGSIWSNVRDQQFPCRTDPHAAGASGWLLPLQVCGAVVGLAALACSQAAAGTSLAPPPPLWRLSFTAPSSTCSAYFLAKLTAETPLFVISPLLFSSIVYFMIGYQVRLGAAFQIRVGPTPSPSDPRPAPLTQATVAKFFIFAAFMMLTQLAAVSLAQAVSALCRDVDTSVVVLPMFLEITRLFGGFFLAPALQQEWMVVLDYIRREGCRALLRTAFHSSAQNWVDHRSACSYIRYAYTSVALNELDGLVLTCTPEQLA